MGYLINCKDI